jgi:hypothetical protein
MFSLAVFQVITIGRFWVIAEASVSQSTNACFWYTAVASARSNCDRIAESCVTIPIVDLARTGRREGSRSNNHNRDDASAECARIEVGTDDLLHWELAALIATKPNRGRDARLEEGDKGDLHRRPVFTNDRAQLYNADRTTDG